jgi:hypothetical protein
MDYLRSKVPDFARRNSGELYQAAANHVLLRCSDETPSEDVVAKSFRSV